MDLTERKSEMYDLLFSTTFGCSFGKMKEFINEGAEGRQKVGLFFAKRAYRDFNRTLRLNEKKDDKTDKKIKNAFLDKVVERVVEDCGQLFLSSSKESFSSLHSKTCNNLLKICTGSDTVFAENKKTGIVFSYGQAQKWINMTLKYMYLSGLWKDIGENPCIEEYMHIPVDSYILKASADPEKYGLSKKILVYDKHPYEDEERKQHTYKEGISQPWSQWDEKDYTHFIDQLRKALPEGVTAVEWESQVWIQIANSKNF